MANIGERKLEGALLKKVMADYQRPSMYQVLLLNDDYTPMDFVVQILQQFFGKGGEEAVRIMLKIHYKGEAACGTYTREIAETKVMQVMDSARQNQHPLKCVMKKE